MQAISDNGIGVKEVLCKQFLDGATHSLLHHVIWCCRHFITIFHHFKHLHRFSIIISFAATHTDLHLNRNNFIVYLSIAAAYL